MIRRTPFRQKTPAREPRPDRSEEFTSFKAAPRQSVMREVGGKPTCGPQKQAAVQSYGYMRAVRQLPCDHCGVAGFTQFCHADEGKGTGIKSDCRMGWPGCADRPGIVGCHTLIGTQRIYPKAQRRQYEADAARRTRHKVNAAGMWPKGLEWIEESAHIE